MTLEKKIAIVSVALCLLTSLAFSIHLLFADSYVVEEEIDYTINLMHGAVAKLRELSPLWDMFKEGIDLNTIEWAAH